MIKQGNMTILVVDSDSSIQETCKSLLTKEGYTVFQADTIEKGLAILKKESIDCVLTEIMFGDIVKNGYHILEQIKLIPKRKRPIGLVMTSRKGALAEYSALAAGAHDFIHKPFNNLELLAKVTKCKNSFHKEKTLLL